MKPATLISFSLVVAAVSAPGALCENPAVLDIEGNPVLPNHAYDIIPIEAEQGFGVTHSNRFPLITCPQVAVLSNPSVPTSSHVTFSPHSATTYVPVSTDVSIKFLAGEWPCKESKVWRVDPTSPFGLADISANGFKGGLDSTFKIERAGANYIFVHCGSTFSGCVGVGVFVGPEGKEHLGLYRRPLTVKFMAVKDFLKSF